MFKDITNQRFGRLVVLKRVANDSHGTAMWLCRCDCGNEKEIRGISLRSGLTLSCGCYHKDKLSETRTTHGESKNRIYTEWQKMKSRCYNPNNKYFSYYGGRGICICDEWLNSFESFRDWSLQNGYSDILTIDRIDSNGNYEPLNCRWVSRKVQQNNTRRTRLYTIGNETKSIAGWCEVYNVPHERVRVRLNKGWDIQSALTIPPKR